MKRKRTIYLVDDDEDDRFLMRLALERVIPHINILEFTDGELLLHACMDGYPSPDEQPDLVLMDINMPKMTGLETLSAIRKNDSLAHIPVILVSTNSSEDVVSSAYGLGVNAYLVKPVTIVQYDIMIQAVNFSFLNEYSPVPESKVSVRFRNKSVLVIEDNPEHWNLIQLSLKQSMPEVNLVHTKSLPATMEFMATNFLSLQPSVALILVDLYLPGRQQGLTLIDQLRRFLICHNVQDVPIVVLSASAEADDIRSVYQNKANSYIMKTADFHRSALHLRDICHYWWNIITLPKRKIGRI